MPAKVGRAVNPFGQSGQVFKSVGWMLPEQVRLPTMGKSQHWCELSVHHEPEPGLSVIEMQPSFRISFSVTRQNILLFNSQPKLWLKVLVVASFGFHCELHYMYIRICMRFPEFPREKWQEPNLVYSSLMRKQIPCTSLLFLARSHVADGSSFETLGECWDEALQSVLFLSHCSVAKAPPCTCCLLYLVTHGGSMFSPSLSTGIPTFLYNLMS